MKPAPSSRGSAAARRTRRGRRSESSDVVASSDQGSVLWTVLLLGLIFCLIDVAYILVHVDTQTQQEQQQQQPVTSSSSDTHRNAERDTTRESAAAAEAAAKYQPETSDEQQQVAHHDHAAELSFDKEPIIQILNEAGFHDIDDETLRELPTWTEVTKLYGDKPRIYGLDQCEKFQNHSDPADHFVSTAGSFNSGTNLMAELLIHNCHNPARQKKYGMENRGVRWQVPWGKHSPPGDEEFRRSHKTLKDATVDATEILPAVTIRDPFVWMHSMCRHHYTANWAHDPKGHCPNLVPDKRDLAQFPRLRGKSAIQVNVNYAEHTIKRQHDSLAHMWNDWYNEYVDADFPRLIVRFEDLMFHAKEVTKTVCECAGGQIDKYHPFKYIVESAKRGEAAHGPMHLRTGFIQAIIRYGKEKGRLDGLTQDDLKYAKQHLDRNLMEFFGYLYPSVDDDR